MNQLETERDDGRWYCTQQSRTYTHDSCVEVEQRMIIYYCTFSDLQQLVVYLSVIFFFEKKKIQTGIHNDRTKKDRNEKGKWVSRINRNREQSSQERDGPTLPIPYSQYGSIRSQFLASYSMKRKEELTVPVRYSIFDHYYIGQKRFLDFLPSGS